ncbi:MAG: hypothetical protein ACF8CQ_15035 [Rhodopirellula sp. JB044]|uniref:hypothetical protein n=1 Tax=Rhodopirellula sp. JB044 TaxID=3342844 RepID=UPI00370ADB48
MNTEAESTETSRESARESTPDAPTIPLASEQNRCANESAPTGDTGSHQGREFSGRDAKQLVQGPEDRLFDKVRTWVDVFPWLRLVRVCRVAGGPVWLTHCFLVFAVWIAGAFWLTQNPGRAAADSDPRQPMSIPSIVGLAIGTCVSPSDAFIPRLPFANEWTSGLPGGDPLSQRSNWMLVVWTIVVWLPTSMALVRVGALLTAGRDTPSYLVTFRDAFRRIGRGVLVVILPTLVAAVFAGVVLGLNWLSARVGAPSEAGNWANWLTLPIVLPATLVASVLILGGRFATPLALAALMVEPDPDPLDSLSRGYEYTLRRLPQLVLLIVVAVVISTVVVFAWAAICRVGASLCGVVSAPNPAVVACLEMLPAVVAIMFLWAMTGGIYLLLRQSAGGQEVEEIAVASDHWKSPDLPPVQSQPTV